VAGGTRPDLRSSEKMLPAAQAGARQACDASRDTSRSRGRLTGDGLLRAAEHGFYRAGESDHPPWNSCAGSSHLGHGPADSTSARPPGVVASVLSRMSRPHASLRVRLVQPREREGNRLAQRYRQRTPAMAAGRTHRRWTAREVLSYPLVSVSA
jgi:hypothetical protein